MIFHLLQLCAVLWCLAFFWVMPRRAEPWLWVLVAATTRWLLAPPHVLMSWSYPYGVYLVYMGDRPENPLYGSGWIAFLSVFRGIVGAAPERVNEIHLLLSALTVGVVWAVADHRSNDRGTASLAALVACLLPLPIAVGSTETPLIVCAALLATGLLGVVRGDRAGAGLTALSAGMLAHIRPDQLGLVTVLIAALGWRRAWGAVSLATGLVVLRLWEMCQPDAVPLPVRELSTIPTVLEQLVGRGSTTTLLDPFVTPFWIVPLMAVGTWSAWRERRVWVALLWTTLGVGLVPYFGLHRVTDLARFHLPPMVPAVLLVALAWPVIRTRSGGVKGLIGVAAIAGLVLARHPLGPPLVHDVEDAQLRLQIGALPAGSVVRYDPSRDAQGLLARYIGLRYGVQLTPWSDAVPLRPGELVWRGVGDRWDTPRPTARCQTEPVGDGVGRIETPAWDGGLIALGPTPVRIGLERVTACRAPAEAVAPE